MYKRVTTFFLLLLIILIFIPANAQTATPAPGPIYIVQKGDTLWDIANRFNASVPAIQAANNMQGEDIFVGDRLLIPGLEGLSGILVTKPVPFGETLQSLSRQYRVDPTTLRKLNHIVSPSELYAGYELVILQQEDQPAWPARATLGQKETLLELAVKEDSDPWTIALVNGLSGPSAGLPDDTLYLPSGTSTATPTGLPEAFQSVEVDPLPLVQGATIQLKVTTSQPGTLEGRLGTDILHFFPAGKSNTQVALQGIDGMADPGLYPLQLDLSLEDSSRQSFEQMVLVESGNFRNETINGVEPDTIDPAVTEPELKWLVDLTSKITPERYWQGTFQLPVEEQYCTLSYYGNRRSYNLGAYLAYHTGVDFGVCSPTKPFDIYAPAAGVVVFTGQKTVRGNVIIINHGQGVYSGLFHQEKIEVASGDHVTAGQLIGKIGSTGRVTGPHLHWELWVNGEQVNPLPWLDKEFPH